MLAINEDNSDAEDLVEGVSGAWGYPTPDTAPDDAATSPAHAHAFSQGATSSHIAAEASGASTAAKGRAALDDAGAFTGFGAAAAAPQHAAHSVHSSDDGDSNAPAQASTHGATEMNAVPTSNGTPPNGARPNTVSTNGSSTNGISTNGAHERWSASMQQQQQQLDASGSATQKRLQAELARSERARVDAQAGLEAARKAARTSVEDAERLRAALQDAADEREALESRRVGLQAALRGMADVQGLQEGARAEHQQVRVCSI